MVEDNLQYLAEYALESHTGSPFPYYSREFGIRWFIESQISQTQQHPMLTLNLVDAKTALVIYSQQHAFESPKDLKSRCQNFIAFVAKL